MLYTKIFLATVSFSQDLRSHFLSSKLHGIIQFSSIKCAHGSKHFSHTETGLCVIISFNINIFLAKAFQFQNYDKYLLYWVALFYIFSTFNSVII